MENIFKEFYKNKKVLITGHTGFKGAWLSNILHYLGADITGVALEPKNSEDLFNLTNLDSKIRSYFSDISNKEKLKEVILKEKPEIIFHLAAQSLVLDSYENPYATLTTNVIGTVNLLDILREIDNNIVLINITSDKCYENKNLGKSFKEGDSLGGLDPYSASKAMVEIVSKSYQHSFFINSKIRTCTVRAGNVIGGGDWAENRLVPDIVRSIKSNQEIIIRNPYSTRPWQHVLEPLVVYLLLAYQYSTNYDTLSKLNNLDFEHAWNIGPNRENIVAVKELLNCFTKYFNNCPPINYSEASEQKNYEAKVLSLDSSKIKDYFNWEPKLNFMEAISISAEWYQAYIKNQDMEDFTIKQIKDYLTKP